MLLAGIKLLHVTHNLVDVNGALRTFRCGKARFYNNSKWGEPIVPGFNAESQSFHDEPEVTLEDAFLLSLLMKRKRTH